MLEHHHVHIAITVYDAMRHLAIVQCQHNVVVYAVKVVTDLQQQRTHIELN